MFLALATAMAVDALTRHFVMTFPTRRARAYSNRDYQMPSDWSRTSPPDSSDRDYSFTEQETLNIFKGRP